MCSPESFFLFNKEFTIETIYGFKRVVFKEITCIDGTPIGCLCVCKHFLNSL